MPWAFGACHCLDILIERELCAGDGGTIVAGGDELLEAEPVKVGGEVFKEVAFEGVVAVTVDNLAAEGVFVELQIGLDLFLDVDVLGVKLVLLGRLRGAEPLIHWFAFRLRHSLSFLHQDSPNGCELSGRGSLPHTACPRPTPPFSLAEVAESPVRSSEL